MRFFSSGLWAATLAAALAIPAHGAIWPDQFAGFKKAGTAPVEVKDRPLWDEYGLDGTEEATYEAPGKKFSATAYRLKDSTGALAAYEWQRPADGRPSKLGRLASETKDGVLLAYGNYLLKFDGYKPKVPELEGLFNVLPKLENAALPALAGYLPSRQLVPNSERYVTGPVSLERFDPGIPPSVAAFHVGTEGQLATYKSGSGEMRLAIFSFPTPHIARAQLPKFEQLPGAMVKRSGPLLAVILSPPNADDAERLLASVRYEATLTANERVPTRKDNIGDLVINAFILIGILLAFCVAAGLGFAGYQRLKGRLFGRTEADEAMIVLDLGKR